MIHEPIEELYFRWLYGQVENPRARNPARTYWGLLRQLHDKEFVWFVPNDDNRVADGKELREEFHRYALSPQNQHLAGDDYMERPCSMLEMLIALSRRLAFHGGEASGWFWHMLQNIGLDECSDLALCSPAKISRALDRVIDRTYDRWGNGGLFPLKETNVDQRRVEIWYQMNDYLIERG